MKMNKNSYAMKMNMKSMGCRGVAWIFSGLALVLFMMGAPAFGQYSLSDSTGAITINNDTVSSGEAKNGYPSVVTVPANVVGNLEKVTVTINGFTHGYPNDVVLLLVGPNGTAVPLMGNDGGGVGVTGLTLTFDDVVAGAGTLGTATAISSGTYKAGDNSAFGTTQAFPAPAPSTYMTSLTAFNGLKPANYAGQWSLYVLDDSQPNTGSIASWSLNLYTKPVIGTTNASVTIGENQSAVFNFSASDTTSNATLSASINLSGVTTGDIGYTNASGAFADFITAADFQFSAINPNGTSTVTITPNADLWGTADFSITLTDGGGFTTTSSNISLTVTHVAVAPAISMTTTITTSNGLATATNLISLVSLDGNPGSGLVLSVVATNGAGAGGVNLGNVGVNSNVFTSVAGLSSPIVGRTNSFYFSIVPGGFPVGTSYLNFIVTDTGNNLSTTVPVAVVVDPFTTAPFAGPLVYASTNPLTLAATAHGALSTISITNLTGFGSIGKVTVSVLGLTNIIPSGLALGLQAPDGTMVPLIANPSGNSASTYAELTFADSDGLLNVQGSGVLPAGTILTNYTLNATGGATALADALGGHSPTNTGANNVWTLFVTNTSAAELGISGGWVLDFYPTPLVQAAVQTVSMPESATTNVVFVTSDIVGSQSSAPTVTLSPSITATYSDTALAAASVSTSGSATINGTNYTTNVRDPDRQLQRSRHGDRHSNRDGGQRAAGNNTQHVHGHQ